MTMHLHYVLNILYIQFWTSDIYAGNSILVSMEGYWIPFFGSSVYKVLDLFQVSKLSLHAVPVSKISLQKQGLNFFQVFIKIQFFGLNLPNYFLIKLLFTGLQIFKRRIVPCLLIILILYLLTFYSFFPWAVCLIYSCCFQFVI